MSGDQVLLTKKTVNRTATVNTPPNKTTAEDNPFAVQTTVDLNKLVYVKVDMAEKGDVSTKIKQTNGLEPEGVKDLAKQVGSRKFDGEIASEELKKYITPEQLNLAITSAEQSGNKALVADLNSLYEKLKNGKKVTVGDVVGVFKKYGYDDLAREFVSWVQQYEESRRRGNEKTNFDYASFVNDWKQANEADKQVKEGNATSQKAVDDHSPAETPGSVYLADAVEQGVAKKKGGKKKEG